MSGQLKKTELVAALSEAASVDKKSTTAVLDALLDVVMAHLKKGHSIPVAGLGKISVRERAARTVRNPSTGETMNKPADKVVKFTVAKVLKDSVN